MSEKRTNFLDILAFMFTVYVLYSKNLDRYYTGYTGDPIEIRLKKHLADHKGFTGAKCDWKVAYLESYYTKRGALKRESQIKKWKSRKMIEKLIDSTELSTPTLVGEVSGLNPDGITKAP